MRRVLLSLSLLAQLSAACDAGEGLLVLQITLDASLGRPDEIEVSKGNRRERFPGTLRDKPGLRLAAGRHRVSVVALRGGEPVAERQFEVVVPAGEVVERWVHLEPAAGGALGDAGATAPGGG